MNWVGIERRFGERFVAMIIDGDTGRRHLISVPSKNAGNPDGLAGYIIFLYANTLRKS